MINTGIKDKLTQLGLDNRLATDLANQVQGLLDSSSAVECWRQLTARILTPQQPFAVHRFLHETVFANWDSSRGPPPAWIPSDDFLRTANIACLLSTLRLNAVRELHQWSVDE